MARSQTEKAETHARIVGVAAERLREKGLEGIGVADLMKEAGLTVGGFYKHFGSRGDLVAEAMQAAMGVWQKERAAGARHTLDGVLAEYLQPGHRDHPGVGCAFGALSADLARADGKTRHVATGWLRGSFDFLASLIDPQQPDAARSRAMLAYAAMVGAIALSRIADDEALSLEILENVKNELEKLGERRRG